VTRYFLAVSVLKHINFGNLTQTPRQPAKFAIRVIGRHETPQRNPQDNNRTVPPEYGDQRWYASDKNT
jgi:hypothetical protein